MEDLSSLVKNNSLLAKAALYLVRWNSILLPLRNKLFTLLLVSGIERNILFTDESSFCFLAVVTGLKGLYRDILFRFLLVYIDCTCPLRR